MKTTFRRFQAACRSIKPQARAWQGATLGLIIMIAASLIAFLSGKHLSWSWLIVACLYLFVMICLLSILAHLVALFLSYLPHFYRAVLIGGSLVLLTTLFRDYSKIGSLLLIGVAALAVSLTAGGIWSLIRDRRKLSRTSCTALLFGTAVGVLISVFGVLWYLWPGPAVRPLADTTALSKTTAQPLSLENPSQRGTYIVKYLTYGSGADLHRPEYGQKVKLQTASVDGSPFVKEWEGMSGSLRTRYWGFDAKKLPVNGRVWYPEGKGPFPLVLIVHGNHVMEEYSDPGYAYLGELLASRGMIVVSVDQNFLNASLIDFTPLFWRWRGLDEVAGRGWLLLVHLDQWRSWNKQNDNPFYGKVDMERIALIGHSRGGEAAAIAAAFNRLPFYPDNANIKFSYNFNILAVVALSPSDGLYRPANRGTQPVNINYLAIKGSSDCDIRAFEGLRQYQRIRFTDDEYWFKAAILMDRANHVQFNSVWGSIDASGFPRPGLINMSHLMPQEMQRQADTFFVSAFLEAALRGKRDYLAFFRDHRAGRNYLPGITYITQYMDSKTHYYATFDEDMDVTTAVVPGAYLRGENLIYWYEKRLEQKWRGHQDTNAVFLGWDNEKNKGKAQYVLNISNCRLRPQTESTLTFSMAPHSDDEEPIDLTIQIADRDGNTASLPLSYFSPLEPQFHFRPLKLRLLDDRHAKTAEVVFKNYEFPLHAFGKTNPRLSTAKLSEISLVFDRSKSGLLVLDNIGFR